MTGVWGRGLDRLGLFPVPRYGPVHLAIHQHEFGTSAAPPHHLAPLRKVRCPGLIHTHTHARARTKGGPGVLNFSPFVRTLS